MAVVVHRGEVDFRPLPAAVLRRPVRDANPANVRGAKRGKEGQRGAKRAGKEGHAPGKRALARQRTDSDSEEPSGLIGIHVPVTVWLQPPVVMAPRFSSHCGWNIKAKGCHSPMKHKGGRLSFSHETWGRQAVIIP